MIKPDISPLNCIKNHLVSLSLEENVRFDKTKPAELSFQDLSISTSHELIQPEADIWQVNLKVHLLDNMGKNFPYLFSIKLVGFFRVGEFKDKPNLVGINGTSILFSSAREILLSLTGRGQHPAINLPTVRFKYVAEQAVPVPPPPPPSVEPLNMPNSNQAERN